MAQTADDLPLAGDQVLMAAEDGRWEDVVQALTVYPEKHMELESFYEQRVLVEAVKQHAKHRIASRIDRGFTFHSVVARALISTDPKEPSWITLTSGPEGAGLKCDIHSKPSLSPGPEETESDQLSRESVTAGPEEAHLKKLSSLSPTPCHLQEKAEVRDGPVDIAKSRKVEPSSNPGLPPAADSTDRQKEGEFPINVSDPETPRTPGAESKQTKDELQSREPRSSLDVMKAARESQWQPVFRALTGTESTTDSAGSERQETRPQGETDDAAADREVESINYGIRLTELQQGLLLDYITKQGCKDHIITLYNKGYLFPVDMLESMVRPSLLVGECRFVAELMLCAQYQFSSGCLLGVLNEPAMYAEEDTLLLVVKIAQRQDSDLFNTSAFREAFRKMVSTPTGSNGRREKWEGLYKIAVKNEDLMYIMDSYIKLISEDIECFQSVKRVHLANENAQKLDRFLKLNCRGEAGVVEMLQGYF